VVLVHGEANEMSRLKAALIREYESDPTHNLEVHNPRNTVSSSWVNLQGQKNYSHSKKSGDLEVKIS
jgi:cleavage and polyadenylation specificity factor subunit 3